MRRIIAIAAVALALAGCTPPPNNTFVAPTPQSLQQFVLDTCGYYAELGPLAQLILSFVPGSGATTTASIVSQLGKAVCGSATAPRASAGGVSPVVVSGIVITGKFVR